MEKKFPAPMLKPLTFVACGRPRTDARRDYPNFGICPVKGS